MVETTQMCVGGYGGEHPISGVTGPVSVGENPFPWAGRPMSVGEIPFRWTGGSVQTHQRLRSASEVTISQSERNLQVE